MNEDKIIDKYLNEIVNNQDEYYKDYLKTRKEVANSTAIYKGEPVPFLYQPMFYTNDDINSFSNLTSDLIKILNKIVDRYLKDTEFRKKFGFSKELEELVLIDPGYDINVPVGRFDVFYKDKDTFKFCELNTDGASAMNEDNELDRIILNTKALNKLKDIYNISYLELIDTWVDESINTYKKFDDKNDKPNVAIMDLKGGGTSVEFEEFKKAYIKKGYNAIIVDPRDLVYKDGNLYHDNFKIDMIYRRLVTCELMDNIDEMDDFIKAYKDKSICVIGGIRSQIVHNKIIFKILHDEDTLKYLDINEREYIKNHIPYTAEFEDNKSILSEALKNKDRYVLKPKDLYASKGVYIGVDYNNKEWEEIAKKCFGGEYLLQEFCKPYQVKMVRFNEEKVSVEDFGHLIGLFMYNEKFKGFYTRVGQNSIISSSHGGYSVANLIVKKNES